MTRMKRKSNLDLEVNLGNQVRLWRLHARLKQSEIEVRAGLAHNAVSRIETGEVSPRLETLERLAGALGISIEELQFRTPPPSETERCAKSREDGLLERMDRLPPEVQERLLEVFHTLIDLTEKER